MWNQSKTLTAVRSACVFYLYVCIRPLSVTQNMQHRMLAWLLNNEFEKCTWRNLSYYPNTKILNQITGYPNRGSHLRSTEALSLQPNSSVDMIRYSRIMGLSVQFTQAEQHIFFSLRSYCHLLLWSTNYICLGNRWLDLLHTGTFLKLLTTSRLCASPRPVHRQPRNPREFCRWLSCLMADNVWHEGTYSNCGPLHGEHCCSCVGVYL